MLKIRAHHLLCMRLFSGKGYNEEFTAYLGQLIKNLENGAIATFTLVQGSDHICAHCPNLIEDKTCLFGNEEILQKDRQVLSELRLQMNSTYLYTDIDEKIKLYMTKDAFEACCSSCRWFISGLCSYNKL